MISAQEIEQRRTAGQLKRFVEEVRVRVALGVMVSGWVRDVRVSTFWPIVGTLIAAPLALPAMLIWFWFFIPGVVLAVWQVQFHLGIGSYAGKEKR